MKSFLKISFFNTMKLNSVDLLLAATLLRLGFFLFGIYQDEHMDVPYTDIDYLVFTDAAEYVSINLSPYLRETYRYTPLLSWLILPSITHFYSFGKFLFILADLITGLIILKLLDLLYPKLPNFKKLALSSIWLLNPMVITISTRGSSESVLCVFIMLFVYFLFKKKFILSGLFLGLSIHFKIYPFIYLSSSLVYLSNQNALIILKNPFKLLNKNSIKFLISTILSFTILNLIMFNYYGFEFLQHSYIYHLSRSDHRHNFSLYNISLYFSSSNDKIIDLSKFAFLPQLLISFVLLPLKFSNRNLIKTFFLQTFTFVTFNKVITSQYFIWFLIFLPFTLINSKMSLKRGLICLSIWIISQACWLYNGYQLEFLGRNVFVPNLLLSSVFFFLSNIFILGEFISDI